MHGNRDRYCLIENDDDDDDNDDENDDDDNDYKDDYSYKSVNLKVRTSRFCMEVDLDYI